MAAGPFKHAGGNRIASLKIPIIPHPLAIIPEVAADIFNLLARLAEGVASYFYEEVSQLFCLEQAFGTGPGDDA